MQTHAAPIQFHKYIISPAVAIGIVVIEKRFAMQGLMHVPDHID